VITCATAERLGHYSPSKHSISVGGKVVSTMGVVLHCSDGQQ
jgi:hypothetical protein